MIHLVTAGDAALFRPRIAAMLRSRPEHLVRDRGLNLVDRDGRTQGGLDGAEAAYLLKIADAHVIGLVRVLPVARRDPAAEPAARGVALRWPDGKAVWRISRAMIQADHDGRRLMSEFCAALVAFALIRTIDTFVFVVDPGFFPTLVSMGWDIRPLGPPFGAAGRACLAAELRVRPEPLPIVRGAGRNPSLPTNKRRFSNAA